MMSDLRLTSRLTRSRGLGAYAEVARGWAELLNERIRNNASELRLHGIAESPDELVDRAEAKDLGYREFLDLVFATGGWGPGRPPLRPAAEDGRLPHYKG